MKKRVFWALVLGLLSLSCVVGSHEVMPECHFLKGTRIVYDPSRSKNYDAALGHLAAIPEGFWVHEVAPAYVLAIKAQRDLPEDFQSFTPEQHYLAAIYHCPYDPERIEGTNCLHCPYDPGKNFACQLGPQEFNRTMQHLEAIPKDSPVHDEAIRVIRLLNIQRDRPQDLGTAWQADFSQCMADPMRRMFPGCDLFSSVQANNQVIASYKPPLSKYHYSEDEIIRRAKAAAAQRS